MSIWVVKRAYKYRFYPTPQQAGLLNRTTPHTRVKQILQERADRQRARLPAQDSSPATGSGERNIPICSGVSNE